MKKSFIATLALTACTMASAMTFWYGGVLMGTVCRNGPYFTAYPQHMAQPVGTSCPIRDNWGTVIGYGVVTNE